MNWPQLLSPARLGSDRPTALDPLRSPFVVDSDRITFSSAFRRLQDKTQVFPLADNDYVRTRLTHSLEVASVARSLGARVGAAIVQKHGLAPDFHASDFGAIVSAAALAHDLGNPPFGHTGEDAIRDWFRTSPVAASAARNLTAKQRADFDRYEGNAQGFRIITRLQMPENVGGLRLTCATLGAFTKYPRESIVAGIGASGYRGASAKKFGFQQSEAEHFATVAERCGLLRRPGADAWWARHPLAFLVEAADDICYRLCDLEDGVRFQHVDYGTASELMLAAMGEAHRPARLHEIATETRRVQLLRALGIGSAVEECAQLFLDQESQILAGTFDTPLIDAIQSAPAWQEIIRVSRERIYNTQRGLEIEAASFAILGSLLDGFVGAMDDAATSPTPMPRSRKWLQMLPADLFGPERVPDADPYVRLAKAVDFVSGMTDRYAAGLHKRLKDIPLPGQ